MSFKSIFYVKIRTGTQQVFFPVLRVHFSTYKFVLENIKIIFRSPTSPFSTYKVLTEHVKSFSLSFKSILYVQIPNGTRQVFFPVFQVHFLSTNSYRNTSSIFPYPPSPFPTYKFLPEQIKYFCPVLQVFFLYTIPTRTHQKYFSLSSKYFSLSLKTFLVPIISK